MEIIQLGEKMLELAKEAKTVGTFVNKYNDSIMEYLPRFQQACAGAPFNKIAYCQSHSPEEKDNISSYDLAFIFQYKQGPSCKAELKKVNNKIYNLIIYTPTVEHLSPFLFHFMCDLMVNNKYLKS